MALLKLVRPTAGAPDALALEAWHALTTSPAYAAPGDELAARLGEVGYEVLALPEADASRVSSETAAPTDGVKGMNLLAHTHGQVSEGARALARRLATLATEHGEIAFICHDEITVRAVMEEAVNGDADVEIEVVLGRAPRGHRLLELVKVMARLRGPDGCPWDAEQTHLTLAKHLLDETYELLEAIERGDARELTEELGDLLLQVVFHAQMALDEGTFDIDDVADAITAKLIRRHPHVFGDVEVSGAGEVVANWDVIKSHEKPRESVLAGVPEALPALAYAQKLLRRAGGGPAGFDRDLDESSLGELLFTIVARARELDLDAETALRRAAKDFRDQVLAAERAGERANPS